jgi:hypothetical protein
LPFHHSTTPPFHHSTIPHLTFSHLTFSHLSICTHSSISNAHDIFISLSSKSNFLFSYRILMPDLLWYLHLINFHFETDCNYDKCRVTNNNKSENQIAISIQYCLVDKSMP